MVKVPLHWAVLPRCNLEWAGVFGSARFSLSEWLEENHPDQEVELSTNKAADFTASDRQVIYEAATQLAPQTEVMSRAVLGLQMRTEEAA